MNKDERSQGKKKVKDPKVLPTIESYAVKIQKVERPKNILIKNTCNQNKKIGEKKNKTSAVKE